MFLLKIEFLEKKGDSDAIFASMVRYHTTANAAALGTMIEFVNVTEDTFKRLAPVKKFLLMKASRIRFMRWIRM